MLKKSIAILLVLATVFALAACGKTQVENTTEPTTAAAEPAAMRIYTLKGPTGMGMAKIASELPENRTIEFAASPDEVVSAIVGGKADIAAVPLNMAAVLNKKTNGGVRMLAVITRGVLYAVTSGVEVNSVADLKGKKIVLSGLNATPEYLLNYLLEKNGIDPEKDVELEYKTEHSEVVALAASGAEGIYILPEPNVTAALAKNSELKVSLDLNDEWKKVSEVELAMSALIVRSDYVEKNGQAVKDFMKDYAASVNFVNQNLDEASQLIESFAIVPKAAIAKQAIPRCNIVCITGDEMVRCAKENFSVLFNANPKSVGGELPDDSFYYSAK